MMITHDGLNAQTAKAPKKMLVAYFSHSGNTRTVAEQIREATGADIFEIEPAAAYPTNYQAVVDQAKKEVNSGFKPALKSKPENLGKYDIIFVGSPCWWYTIAPPVATFLSSYDLSGKTIAPFMTHEGSRYQKTVCRRDFASGIACPGRQRARGRSGSGQMVAKNRSDRINFIILPRGHRHDNKSTITSGVHGTFPHLRAKQHGHSQPEAPRSCTDDCARFQTNNIYIRCYERYVYFFDSCNRINLCCEK